MSFILDNGVINRPMMNLATLASAVKGHCLGNEAQPSASVAFNTVAIDGRQCVPDALFIAIDGERVDGHDYVEQAAAHGAVAALVSRQQDYSLPAVLVQDTLQALARLACYHRDHLSPKVIAVTGSCGKTTVKEMIKSILPATSFATQGNFNNHIGVPLSLLSLTPAHTHAVIELGANHIGEIAQTVAWVKPDVAMINNIGAAHLEGFGSLEGVATAKSEIFGGLNTQTGIAVVNMDDPRVVEKASALHCQRLNYGLSDTAQIRATDLQVNTQGCYAFTLTDGQQRQRICLRVPGRHHVNNALAAASCTLAVGCEWSAVVDGLAEFDGVAGRLTFYTVSNGACLIDDTYNANPSSVQAAIDVLAAYGGRRILVLGELGELGDYRDDYYREIGQYAKSQGLDALYSCGQAIRLIAERFGNGGEHFDSVDDLSRCLSQSIDQGCTILVKGSRVAGMERLVEALRVADTTG